MGKLCKLLLHIVALFLPFSRVQIHSSHVYILCVHVEEHRMHIELVSFGDMVIGWP